MFRPDKHNYIKQTMRLKHTLALVALALCSTVTAQNYRYESVKGDPMQSRIYTLDNGLKIYLSVNKEKPRLQTYIAVRTGSRNDPAETTGLAHYLEHLMFKGTTHFGSSNMQAEAPLLDSIQNRYEKYRRMTDPAARKKAYHEIDSISQLAARYNIPNEYDKLMSSIGSEGSNAYTSNDVTCYVEDIPANEIETWARIQSDRFRNMVIRGFHTELESVYEEFNIGLTNDGRKSWAALNKKLYPNHPYGTQTTIGTQEHLKNPSIINIKNYYNRYYVPNNVAICMAGDFDPDRVVAIIDKYFGDWKKNESLSRPEYAPIADYTSPVDTTVIGLEAEYAMVGWKTEGASSFQADTLNVIADILSNGKAGLLDVNLNMPMKVQESAAYYEGLHDYGQFVVQIVPKQGQSLETAKDLVLAEVEKLKQGRFADNLLSSVVNNMKLRYYSSLLSNKSRADKFVDAFINEQKWEDQVNALNRMGGMTKQQIVDFANRHLRNNYVIVYKRQGTDTTVQKIDKPAITPIPTNNDKQSAFLKEIVNTPSATIQPRFVDFDKDLTKTEVDANTKMLYKQNADDDLFTLRFAFQTGHESDSRLAVAADLMDYVGTSKMSANDVKKAFYAIACDYNVNVSSNLTSFTITGLNENMPAALKLFATLLEDARISKADYNSVTDLIIKARDDRKKSQRENFNALRNYGVYGSFNPTLNQMSNAQMKSADGNSLLAQLKSLRHSYPLTVMYFGPSAEKEVISLVQKNYPRKKSTVKPRTSSMTYSAQPTEKSEILIAPYDAKNIYMVQYTNSNSTWSPDNAAMNALFNEYYGGGMNAIVFQELREARGLAYSASARYVEPSRRNDKEYFYTYIITQSDKMMDCVNEFNHLLNDIPQRQAGFDLAKQGLLKSLSTRRTTRFNVLQAYMDAQRLGLDYDLNRKIYEQLPAIKMEDLVRYAAERISNRPYKYLILGDEKNLDIKSLEKIAPIRRVTTKEIFGY